MKIIPLLAGGRADGPSVLTLGIFDGLHRGHQVIIREVVSKAAATGWLPTVVTFDPHPRAILQPESTPPLIQTFEQRLEGLEALGVRQVAVIRFSREAASIEAEEFIGRYLFDQLDAREIYLGRGAAFGHARRGNLEMLKELGPPAGRTALEIDEIRYRGRRVSATWVRDLIHAGRVNLASKLLLRPFTLTGLAARGGGLGGSSLLPTAKLIALAQILPAAGVYASAVLCQGVARPALTYVGPPPTREEGGARAIESHLLDSEGDVRGQIIRLGFLHRLRGERPPTGIDARQIEKDIAKAKRHLSRTPHLELLKSWRGW